MAEYFRDVERPEDLVPRERHPRTGRRVPKSRSKGREASRFGALTGRRLLALVAAVAVAGGAAVVLASRDDSNTIGTGAADTTTPAATEAADTTPASSTVLPTSVVSTLPATTAAPTTAPPTTAPVTSLVALVPLRLRMEPLPAVVQVIPADPGATATYNSAPPEFTFAVDCLNGACTFPLTVNFPGAVTAEGFNFVDAVDGHIDYRSSKVDSCTGSQGTVFSREIVSTTSLTLSGAQQIADQAYPQRLSGTLTTVFPEAGFVPHVGDAFPTGTETGCSGETLIFTVDAPLSPAPS
jgi:hypothetical protein